MKIFPVSRTILRAFSMLALALPVHAAVDEVLGADNARHLLNRTGFAASGADIGVFAKLNRTEAVDRLLKATQSVTTQTPPAWVS